jgi:hypothetical protein
MSSINDTITNINGMYNAFNTKLEADLPKDVVFTLIPNHNSRSKYLGWFFRSRWVKGTEVLHEINIAPDFLNRPVDQIAETLIHEMCHLKNFVAGIKDCTATQYHNKAFKKAAESFGLKVERMRNKGYAITSLDEKAKGIVEAYKTDVLKGDNPFVTHRVSEVKIPKVSTKKSVAIDQELAEDILKVQGGKLGGAVNHILRDWVNNQVK